MAKLKSVVLDFVKCYLDIYLKKTNDNAAVNNY